MGVVIHATRLMQPGEFALWGDGKLVASGLLGSRLEPTAFDAVALHVDDSAVFCLRLAKAAGIPAAYLAQLPDGGSMRCQAARLAPRTGRSSLNQGDQLC